MIIPEADENNDDGGQDNSSHHGYNDIQPKIEIVTSRNAAYFFGPPVGGGQKKKKKHEHLFSLLVKKCFIQLAKKTFLCVKCCYLFQPKS